MREKSNVPLNIFMRYTIWPVRAHLHLPMVQFKFYIVPFFVLLFYFDYISVWCSFFHTATGSSSNNSNSGNYIFLRLNPFLLLLFFPTLFYSFNVMLRHKKTVLKKKNLFIYNEDLKETQKKKQRKNDVDDKLFKQSAKPIY